MAIALLGIASIIFARFLKRRGIRKKYDRDKSQEEIKPAGRQTSILTELIWISAKIGLIALIAVLLFTFVFGLMAAPDLSMSPAVKAGDLVLYYRLESSLKVSDVVIVNVEGEKQIRRVAAIAGDEVDITENGLKVNGYIQQESEISGQTIRFEKRSGFSSDSKKKMKYLCCVTRGKMQGTAESMVRSA